MKHPRLAFAAGFFSGAIVASQAPVRGPYVAAVAGLIPLLVVGLLSPFLDWLENRS